MTRMSTAALFLLLSTPAFAASTVVKTTGDAKVGKAGAFKPAKPGSEIPSTEFLVLGDGAKATVKLEDGTTAEFSGKVMVPGRRLVNAKEAGALIRVGQSIQKAAESV